MPRPEGMYPVDLCPVRVGFSILPQKSLLLLLAGAESNGLVRRSADSTAAVRSLLHTQRRLALLGDSVLALETTELLMRCAPFATAADISDARSDIESNIALSQIARRGMSVTNSLLYPNIELTGDYVMGLGSNLSHGSCGHAKQDTASPSKRTSKSAVRPYADAVEGVLGLIAADLGRNYAAAVARTMVVAPLA